MHSITVYETCQNFIIIGIFLGERNIAGVSLQMLIGVSIIRQLFYDDTYYTLSYNV